MTRTTDQIHPRNRVETRWLTLSEIQMPSLKTKVWAIHSKETGAPLGQVRWFSRWRCYVFAPNWDSAYEQDCLRDLADFIEKQTAAHRAGLKQVKEALHGGA